MCLCPALMRGPQQAAPPGPDLVIAYPSKKENFMRFENSASDQRSR